MRLFLTLGAASAVLASLVLVACGGGDDDGQEGTSPAGGSGTPAATSGKTGSPVATTQASPTEAATKAPGEGQVTGSGATALRQLAKDLSDKTYEVSYAMNLSGGDSPGKGSLVSAQKPPKSITKYETTDASGVVSTFAFINDGVSSFLCFKEGSDPGQCMKSKADASTNIFGSIFSVKEALKDLTEDIEVKDAGSRTIGGVDSRCFTVKEATGDGTACFSKKDGILTLLDTKNEDGSVIHIEASKASGSVDDKLFAPPEGYEVVDLGR